MRLNALKLNPQQQPSMPRYLLYLINLGLLGSQLRLEVPPDPEELLGLLPFLGVLVPTVLTLALHDPLRQVEVLPIYLKLNRMVLTFLR